jgi:hypothetical protein
MDKSTVLNIVSISLAVGSAILTLSTIILAGRKVKFRRRDAIDLLMLIARRPRKPGDKRKESE